MAKQLHKKFPNEQVKSLFKRYLLHDIKIDYILEILGINRSRFFEILKEYREDPENFSIAYKREKSTRRISKEIEENILKELSVERGLIGNRDMPIRSYNYSYIRDQLWSKYGQKVPVPAIIDRAKKNNFYFPRKERKSHDREVLSNYVGELIQHDSSWHKWSPNKWLTLIEKYHLTILNFASLGFL